MMRRNNIAPPIVYSTEIENLIKFINYVKKRYQECGDYMKYAGDATQDLLHTMELCVATAPERNMVYSQMSEIRKLRRAAKNEEAILTPLIIWINDHEKELKSLEMLLGQMRKIENNLNGERYYRSRTDIVEKLFGTTISVLELPAGAELPKNTVKEEPKEEEPVQEKAEDEVEIIEEVPHEEVEEIPENPNTFEEGSDDFVDPSLEEVMKIKLEYPVVIYFHKKKRTGTYYYTFPGLEKSQNPHAFPSGDSTMNLRNKKLLKDIEVQFHELLLRYTDDLPTPISQHNINPDNLRKGMRIGSVKSSAVITQSFMYTNTKRELLKNHFI